MALVPHRIKKGQVEHASLGTASRHGVATVASASDDEDDALSYFQRLAEE